MHFGGIRKPRTYSNKDLCQQSGWLLPNASDVGEGGDINFNFSAPGMSEWYASTHAHFVQVGAFPTLAVSRTADLRWRLESDIVLLLSQDTVVTEVNQR